MTDYVWDPRKAAANQRKHGVSFALAAEALNDPAAMFDPDPHPDGDRWRTVGQPRPGLPLLLFVVHTDPYVLGGTQVVRIISARRVTRDERRRYEAGSASATDP